MLRLKKGFDAFAHVPDGVANYAALSEQMVAEGRRAGARLLWIVPLRNLKDFPPRPDDQGLPLLNLFQAAELLRPHRLTASEAYRLGRYYAAHQDIARARRLLTLASDLNPGVGRVHSAVIEAIKRLPARYPEVAVYDPEPALERSQKVGLLGDETFVDWCHLRLETHLELARLIADQLTPGLSRSLGSPQSIPENLDALLPDRRDYEIRGLDEAGFYNIQFFRYPQARDYFQRRLNDGFSIQAAIGLAISDIQLGKSQEATRWIREFTGRASPEDIQKALGRFPSPQQEIFRAHLAPLKKEFP